MSARAGAALVEMVARLVSARRMALLPPAGFLGAALTAWIETPLQGEIRGYSIALLEPVAASSGLAGGPRPVSIGAVCLLAAVLVSPWGVGRWCPALRRGLGALLGSLVLAFAVVVGVRATDLVEALVDQNRERNAIIAFASEVGRYAATLPPIDLVGTATLADRVQTLLGLLGWGWWAALLASLIALVQPLPGRAGRRGRPWRLAAWVGLLLAGVAALALPAILADRERSAGDTLHGAGHYQAALRRFDGAMGHLPGLARNPALAYRIGAARSWLGDRTSPEVRVFLAQNLLGQRDFARADAELALALDARPDSALLRRRRAELLAAWGVALYREGVAGSAERWEAARRLDPSLLRAGYFIAATAHVADGRDQRRAIAEAEALVARTRDRGVRADLYALLGDSHFKAGRDVEAREMYRRSLAMVPLIRVFDVQAQVGLVGL